MTGQGASDRIRGSMNIAKTGQKKMTVTMTMTKKMMTAAVVVCALASGCRKPTEIVVDLSVMGPLPAVALLSVRRQLPFNDVL